MHSAIVNGKLKMRGISNAEIRAMEPEQLAAELQRVEDQMTKLHRNLRGAARWLQNVPEVKMEYRCLLSEKHRIERELDARALAPVRTLGERAGRLLNAVRNWQPVTWGPLSDDDVRRAEAQYDNERAERFAESEKAMDAGDAQEAMAA